MVSNTNVLPEKMDYVSEVVKEYFLKELLCFRDQVFAEIQMMKTNLANFVEGLDLHSNAKGREISLNKFCECKLRNVCDTIVKEMLTFTVRLDQAEDFERENVEKDESMQLLIHVDDKVNDFALQRKTNKVIPGQIQLTVPIKTEVPGKIDSIFPAVTGKEIMCNLDQPADSILQAGAINKEAEISKPVTSLNGISFGTAVKEDPFMPKMTVYKCFICQKVLKRKANLLSHIRSHTGEKPHCCQQCEKSFSTFAALVRHKGDIHSNRKPKQCLNCKKFYKNYGYFKLHEKICEKNRPVGWVNSYVCQCEQCGKTLANKGSLSKHIKLHTGERPYKCTECEKTFVLLSTLKVHSRKHTGEKPYQCLECGKVFSQKSGLNLHENIHSGLKPYHCNFCDKAFRLKSSLKTHTTTHTGERPYSCVHCDKTFGAKNTLRNHVRIHTGERPFHCEHCGKTFRQRVALKQHMIIHTGLKPYKCETCGKSFSSCSSYCKHRKLHSAKLTVNTSQNHSIQ